MRPPGIVLVTLTFFLGVVGVSVGLFPSVRRGGFKSGGLWLYPRNIESGDGGAAGRVIRVSSMSIVVTSTRREGVTVNHGYPFIWLYYYLRPTVVSRAQFIDIHQLIKVRS